MRDDRLYLVDIQEAAAAIDRFIAGMNENEWIENEVRQSAVMHDSPEKRVGANPRFSGNGVQSQGYFLR